MAATSLTTSHLNPFLLSRKTPAPKTQPSLSRSHRHHQFFTPLLSTRSTTTLPPLPSLPIPTPTPTHQTLKSRLAAGETLYGLFLLSFSPTLAEIAGLAGYDYVVIDMEHGHGGISDALPCLRALSATSTPAILRLPEATPAWAKKALDVGPAGLMFPNIETPVAASETVSFCRFPPRGVRGAAHPLVRASHYGLDDSYLARVDDDLLIICQVESINGIQQIGDIAAVDGVDVVQMGPLDLSASMGYLWDPGNRKVKDVLKEAERKVFDARWKRGGESAAYLGGFAMPSDPAEQLKLRGYHMVAGAADIGLFRNAAVEDVRRFASMRVEVGEEADVEDEEDEEEMVARRKRQKDDGYWSE